MVDAKLKRLVKYQQELQAKLSSTVPTKHANREKAWRQMLEKDLTLTKGRVEELRLSDKKPGAV